jgi:hypothetical protein
MGDASPPQRNSNSIHRNSMQKQKLQCLCNVCEEFVESGCSAVGPDMSHKRNGEPASCRGLSQLSCFVCVRVCMLLPQKVLVLPRKCVCERLLGSNSYWQTAPLIAQKPSHLPQGAPHAPLASLVGVFICILRLPTMQNRPGPSRHVHLARARQARQPAHHCFHWRCKPA